MNKFIENILNDEVYSDKDKRELFNEIKDDIRIAEDILNGKYTYCTKCKDYYLTKSFLTETETKPTKICTYQQDPINSGGNDYADGYVDITYLVCPKGHKHDFNRKERLK